MRQRDASGRAARLPAWAGYACVATLCLAPCAWLAHARGGVAPAVVPAAAATIVVDYPLPGSLFPPDFAAPTVQWRDPAPGVARWRIEVRFEDGQPPLRTESNGEPPRIGVIDPRCVSSTNEPPRLTPEQAAAHTWRPAVAEWALIRQHSVERPAELVITGLRDGAAVSEGRLSLRTSRDPVGAPIFYRDVPLMPTEGEKGVIQPLSAQAVRLIAWRLRDVSRDESRTLIDSFPTCANCHSFSADGKTLGVDVDGPQNDKGLYALVNVRPQTSIRTEDVVRWSSFRGAGGGRFRVGFMSQVSPDGQHVVTMINDPGAESRERMGDVRGKYYAVNFKDYRFLQVFYPTRGILATYDRAGAKLTPLHGADDPDYVQTNAAWSPDGAYIVFARARARDPFAPGAPLALRANDPNETQIRYNLYRVPFNHGRGGHAEAITGASSNGMSNSFPKVSPDGKWIVFVQARNGLLMRPDSQLYIVPSGGGVARRMRCNTPLMNSWHSFSPNGRWLVFSSKSRSPYTQLLLTHIDADGNDTPAILIENTTAANRAANIPEFVNVAADGLLRIESPATEFYRLSDVALELGKQGRYAESAEQWERALALNPGDAGAEANLGVSLARAGRPAEALAHLEKALAADPLDASVHANAGGLLAQLGRPGEALEHFQRAVALAPKSAHAHYNLGAALYSMHGDERAAELEWRTALRLDANYLPALRRLAWMLAVRSGAPGRTSGEALVLAHRAVALAPEDAGTLDALAAAYADAGEYAEAARTARLALDAAARQQDPQLSEQIRKRLELYTRGQAWREAPPRVH
jgi:Flp pilus assembly protein TadD